MANEQPQPMAESYYNMLDEPEMVFLDVLASESYDTGHATRNPTCNATVLPNRPTLPAQSVPDYSGGDFPTSTQPLDPIAAPRVGPCYSPTTTSASIDTAVVPTSCVANSPSPPFGFQQVPQIQQTQQLQQGLCWSPSSVCNSLYSSGSDNSAPASTAPVYDLGFSPCDGRSQVTLNFPYGRGGSTSSGGEYIIQDAVAGIPQQPGFGFEGIIPTPWQETSGIDDGENGSVVMATSMSPPAATPPSPNRRKRARKSISSSSRSKAAHSSVSPGKSDFEGNSAAKTARNVVTKPQLRSASRTSKNTYHTPAKTVEERNIRASHNMVEKHYRNRLNAQFESLLQALPNLPIHSSDEGDDSRSGKGGNGDGDTSNRRVSKAEVLDMARRHIKHLDTERDELQRERNKLLDTMKNLKEYAQDLPAADSARLVAAGGYQELSNLAKLLPSSPSSSVYEDGGEPQVY